MATAEIENTTLTVEELRQQLDELVRARLGFGVDEFSRQYRAHALDLTSPEVEELAMMVRLLWAAG